MFYELDDLESDGMTHIKPKIVMKDIDCNTFEFIREYVHGFNPIITKSSAKYVISILYKATIKFIKDKWIINRDNLFHFLIKSSNADEDINNQSVENMAQLILKNNNVLKRYGDELFIRITKFKYKRI